VPCHRQDGAGVARRQVEREGTAAAGRAVQGYLPAQQLCEFAADREAEAGSPMLARRAGIRLLEGFEDDLLLVQRNAYPRVADRERDDAPRLVENRMPGRPALLRRTYPQADAAALGELE